MLSTWLANRSYSCQFGVAEMHCANWCSGITYSQLHPASPRLGKQIADVLHASSVIFLSKASTVCFHWPHFTCNTLMWTHLCLQYDYCMVFKSDYWFLYFIFLDVLSYATFKKSMIFRNSWEPAFWKLTPDKESVGTQKLLATFENHAIKITEN